MLHMLDVLLLGPLVPLISSCSRGACAMCNMAQRPLVRHLQRRWC